MNIDIPRISGWISIPLSMTTPFLERIAPMAETPGTVILASGSGHEEASRNILAAEPLFTLSTKNGRTGIRVAGSFRETDTSPLALIDEVRTILPLPEEAPPFGLYGFLGYDLKRHIESLPDTVIDDLELPEFHLHAPRFLLVEEGGSRTLHVARLASETEEDARRLADTFWNRLNRLAYPISCRATGPVRSNVNRNEFLDAVSEIRDRIEEGEIYQVNYSQRYSVPFEGSPFDLFLKMFRKNPAPFFSYMHETDWQIVSSSPERFLKVEDRRAETRPIKGTLPRGTTPEEDRQNRAALKKSAKDAAELAMIVDLMRNDLGRVSEPGSVRVTDPCRIEAWTNVFHRVAVIESTLKEEISVGELLSATFPPGSVTGCPKIRSMAVIDELERVRRHVYTGAMGMIGFQDVVNLSVAIRTVIAREGHLHFSTGGGMVWDSVPEMEYQETRHKAATFFSVLEAPKPEASPILWQDGRFLRQDAANTSLVEDGVIHGAGIMETLRIVDGTPIRLDAHITRMKTSVSDCLDRTFPRADWKGILNRLMKRNGMTEGTLACNMVALKEKGGLSISIRIRRSSIPWNRKGISLVTHPEPFETPLSIFKTTNRMVYSRVLEEAGMRGADDGLILSSDGRIVETAIANLMVLKEGRVLLPDTAPLPGVTQRAVLDHLVQEGWKVKTAPLRPDDLPTADLVLATSSLRGVVRVHQLDGIPLPEDSDAMVEHLRRATGFPTEIA